MPIVNEHDTTLLDIARAYQAEYDGLRNSRVISLWLKLKRALGKGYDPLTLDGDWPQSKVWMRLESRTNPLNRDFTANWRAWTSQLTASNGSAYWRDARRPRVGIITDEFMYDYYDDALDLTYLYPEGYEQAIDEGDFDFVLYVSCWIGRYERGEHYYTNDPAGHERIARVLEYAKRAGVPVVFQSIEDPPSYHQYLDLARMADFVFTSCEEKVADYMRDLGHDRVFACKFGVNPQLNNPVGTGLRERLGSPCLKNSVFFAGTWYEVYPQRCQDTRDLFDAILREGRNITLADRRWPGETGDNFPQEYWHYLVPALEHKDLQAVTKLFDYAVNMNTVKDSTTMCAMRTYELQAAGVIGLSNDALALKTQFPELPRLVEQGDLTGFFDRMGRAELLRQQRAGVRRVMSRHTVHDRLNEMLSHMGMNELRFPERRIAIVVPHGDEEALLCARSQTLDGATVVVDSGDESGIPLDNAGALLDGFDFALFLRGGSWAPTLAEDARNATFYTDCDYVTACAPESPERYEFAGRPAPCAGTLFDLRRISPDELIAAFRTGKSVGSFGFIVPSDASEGATR